MSYEIGDRIKRFRESSGIKATDFANKLGISTSRLSNWENGTNRPNADQIANIIEMLNVDANELLGISKNRAKDVRSQICKEIEVACAQLNDDGLNKLLDYALDLTALDKYKKGYIEYDNMAG